MSKLNELFERQGQSPWLDNLKRDWLTSGEIQQWIDAGVRGITSNPSIFQKAIESSEAYTAQLAELHYVTACAALARVQVVDEAVQTQLQALAASLLGRSV